jgi:hypothetical protein
MNVENLTATIVNYLTFRELPPTDAKGRPYFAYGGLIHNQCERRAHFEFGEYVLAWGDEAAQKGWCLYKLGCKGPETFANCPTERYAEGTSWPVKAGHGCVGCTMPRFWDAMSPFYRRLPPPVPLMPTVTVDHVGQALVGGVAAVTVTHGAVSYVRSRRTRAAERHAARAAEAAAAEAGAAEVPDAPAAGTSAAVEPAAAEPDAAEAPAAGTSAAVEPAAAEPEAARRRRQRPARSRRWAEMTRLAIDPVTRVGGHLRIEVEVADGAVRDAWSAGTMFRGMELILRGRDPRDAWLFAERICGASTTVHALASVRAVENALGLTIPRNARLLRNLVAGAQYLADHVVHFYHLHALDWIDAVAALRADPAATSKLARSMSDWPLSSPTYFRDVRDRIARFMETGRGGPFANGYWGHPAYLLSPEPTSSSSPIRGADLAADVQPFHVSRGKPPPRAFVVGGMAAAAWCPPAVTGRGIRQWTGHPIAPSEAGLADMEPDRRGARLRR